MPLTNAEKPRRWRDKRSELAQVLSGTPKEITDCILFKLGAREAKRVLRALDKRLLNLKSDCLACNGTGFMTMNVFNCSGGVDFTFRHPCDCGENAAAQIEAAKQREARLRNPESALDVPQ
jgi:hypothetical protein